MAEQRSPRHGFWVTNRVANPLLRRVLRGRLGRRMGRRLAVLRYRGRRTGAVHELVVQYVRDGSRVWVMVGEPERKRWWRNMVQPVLVDLVLAGHGVSGVARAIDSSGQPDEVARAVATYVENFPRARPAIDRRGPLTVMVRIDLSVDLSVDRELDQMRRTR